MKKVSISDVTMKQGGKACDFDLTFKEKLEVAKLLDRLGADCIECAPIENKKIDTLLIKSIAVTVGINLLETIKSVWSVGFNCRMGCTFP